MVRAVYAGSFDPFTNGHLDLVERASHLFEEVIVVVSHNPRKSYVFSLEERVRLVQSAVSGLAHVRVVSQEGGLTVQGARQLGASVLVRGVRSSADVELEATLASHNHQLSPEIETVILLSRDEWRYVSASMVKELAKYGGEYHHLVPEGVYEALESYYRMSSDRLMQLKEEE